MATTVCPSEDGLARYLGGHATPEACASIEHHLADCGICHAVLALLAEPDTGLAQTRDQADDSVPERARARPGEMVGRYRVIRALGEGAMGVVYAADDPELHRRVAVKLVAIPRRTHGSISDVLELLRAEAVALARISDPNVVRVFDVGVHGRLLYIVMELLEGPTLAEWIETRPSWRDVVARFVEVARGLAAAHDAGLVHRDVKPGNVLLHEGRAVVTDFGLARAQPEPTSDDARMPALVGTPAYMAPEVVRGAGCDARSDQFSFCVAMWQALFGVRPFAPVRIPALAGPRERAAARSVGVPGMPAALVRTVLRGLALDPRRRFASMRRLAAQLDRCVAPRRRVAVGAIATLIAAAGLTILLPFDHRSEPADDRTAISVHELQAKALLAVADVVAARGGAEEAEWLLELADDAAARAGDDELAADVRITQVWVVGVALARHDAGEVLLRSADAALRRIGDPPRRRATLLLHAATMHDDAGDPGRARIEYEQGLALATALPGDPDPVLPRLSSNLALLLAGAGEHQAALAAAERAVAWQTQISGAGDPFVATALSNLGVVQARAGQLALAETTFAAALAIRETSFGGSDPRVAATLANLATLRAMADDLDGAEAAATRALEIVRAQPEPDAQEIITALELLGGLALRRGRPDLTLAHCEALALELARSNVDPDAAITLADQRGSAWAMLGDYGRAEHSWSEAVAIARQRRGPDAPQTASLEVSLADALEHLGRRDEAKALLDHALPLVEDEGAHALASRWGAFVQLRIAVARGAEPRAVLARAREIHAVLQRLQGHEAHVREITRWIAEHETRAPMRHRKQPSRPARRGPSPRRDE